jgi:hypothetical protein
MVAIKTLIVALAIGSVTAAPNGYRKERTRKSTSRSHTATSIATPTAVSSAAPEKDTTSAITPITSPTTAALPVSTAAPAPSSPANSGVWQPAVGSKWQIQLSQLIKVDSSLDPTVGIYDIDMFDTPQSSIDQLHALGKKVICYFSAGSYEPNRPDSSQFTASDKGKGLDGWPGEYWLDVTSANVRSIMAARLKLAASKGCDGVDPDNVDGYVSLP